MIYFMKDGCLEEGRLEDRKEIDFRPCFAVLSQGEMNQKRELLGIHERVSSENPAREICRCESHDGFDYITVSIPDREQPLRAHDNLVIYVKLNLMVFIYETESCRLRLEKLLKKVMDKGMKSVTLEHILYQLFDELTAGDSFFLEGMEQKIFDMEESMLRNLDGDYISQILDLRRQLMALKRYYEQLLDIFEAMEENENGLLGKKTARAFGILTSRTDRLADGVISLRDYVSQVRESYQAQVDITQNQVMKLFTVITAIFLPLNLIAAWYGMNLKMPEYHMAVFYPVVIVISVLVVIGCFWYFKKHRWF